MSELDIKRYYLQQMGIESWVKRQPDPVTQLSQLALNAAACTQCPLHATRKSSFFAQGSPSVKMMVIGDAPSCNDARTRPLLEQMWLSLGLRSDDVYMTYLLKCDLPLVREPQSQEIESCRGFLEQQIQWVAPQFILALGPTVGSFLLGQDTPLETLRLQRHVYQTIPFVVTYLPQFLLDNPHQKKHAYLDMLVALKQINIA